MTKVLSILFLFWGTGLFAQGWGSLSQDLALPGKAKSRVEAGELSGEYRFILEIPPGYYQDKDSPFFRMEADPPFRTLEVVYPPTVDRQGKPSYQGTVALLLKAAPPEAGPVPGSITLRTGYQICQEDGICLLPVEESTTLSWSQVSVDTPGLIPAGEGAAWLLQLFFAFLGGLLLNLMPCVFPLLSVKSLALVKNQSLGGKGQRSLAWWYAAGIMTSLLAAALFLGALKSAGEAAGWGFYFQNSGFVLFLTALLWAFGLSLLGLFSLPAAGMGSAGLNTPRGAFASGLLAVLAAAPCTAPFLGSAMGFAFAQPLWVLLFFFLSAGVGFALPYVVLAHLPGLLKKIPRPGPWMETFEHLMGFLLVGWALVTLATLHTQISLQGFWNAVSYLFGGAILLWGLGRWARPVDPPIRRRLLWILGLFLLFSGGYITSTTFSSPEEKAGREYDAVSDGWEPFSREALDRALAQGQPVFVDIWAQWCTNCKINEALVLSRPEVLSALDRGGVLRLKGDLSRPDKVLTDFLALHGRAGLPFYVFYAPGEAPRILPEILTPNMITSLVEP